MKNIIIIKIKPFLICLTGVLFVGCTLVKPINDTTTNNKTNVIILNNKEKSTSYIDDSSIIKYAGNNNSVSEVSESGNYRFFLYSKSLPIPLRKIHNWIVKVETNQGEPVTNARLYVSGGMPLHRHGFPTKPVVQKHLGQGEYLVEGIKFSMPGDWQMRFTMQEGKQRERAIFKIKIQ